MFSEALGLVMEAAAFLRFLQVPLSTAAGSFPGLSAAAGAPCCTNPNSALASPTAALRAAL